MANLEIPHEVWQALQARATLDSSESVSWPSKTIIQRAPNWEDEEVDCTYIAQCYKGRVWVDMLVSTKWQDTSALTVQPNQQLTGWQELTVPTGRGYLYVSPGQNWGEIPIREWPPRPYDPQSLASIKKAIGAERWITHRIVSRPRPRKRRMKQVRLLEKRKGHG